MYLQNIYSCIFFLFTYIGHSCIILEDKSSNKWSHHTHFVDCQRLWDMSTNSVPLQWALRSHMHLQYISFKQHYRRTVLASAVSSTPGQMRKERKNFAFRKQEVSTQCPQQIQIPKQNKAFPKHNTVQSEASRPPKAFWTFWSSLHLHLLMSFQKQSWFQVKQAFCKLLRWGGSLCFDKK